MSGSVQPAGRRGAAPQYVIDALLVRMSANRAAAALREAGYDGNASSLDTRVSQLIASGQRTALSAPTEHMQGVNDRTDITALAAQMGSASLHKATLALFDRTAATHRSDRRTVAVWLHGTVGAAKAIGA